MLINAYTVYGHCWSYLSSPLLWELIVLLNQRWACELGWVKHRVLYPSVVSDPASDGNLTQDRPIRVLPRIVSS